MKTKLFFILFALSCLTSYCQNITNTLGTNGTFTIKNSSTSYLTLSQATGNTSVLRNFELGGLTNSTSAVGVITKNGTRFIHNYWVTGTGGRNIFIGLNSGNFTMSGSGGQASYNSAVGEFSLTNLTTGSYNSAFGSFSLALNTTGNYNSSFGDESLYSNGIGNNNSAFGPYSLYSNTGGNENSAFGTYSLYSNTQGDYNSAFGNSSLYSNKGSNNSAFGFQSLYHNIFGYSNLAFGYHSLFNNTDGASNIAIGDNAGSSITTGSDNIVIGNSVGSNIVYGNNNICIGDNSLVPNGLLSNQVRIGNTSVTYAGIQVAWTITSDRRLKDNILNSNLGLNFIRKLNPVSYFRKNDESKKIEYGLIAQEVEEVLKQEGVENSSMITITDEGNYELRYNDLLAPMIKAIQELNEENQKLKITNQILEERLVKMEESQKLLSKKIEMIGSNQNEISNIKSAEK